MRNTAANYPRGYPSAAPPLSDRRSRRVAAEEATPTTCERRGRARERANPARSVFECLIKTLIFSFENWRFGRLAGARLRA